MISFKQILNESISTPLIIKRIEDIKDYLSNKYKMTSDEFLDYEIDNDLDFSEIENFESFGIRYHKKGLKDNKKVPNSYEIHDGIVGKQMNATSALPIQKNTNINKLLKDINSYYDTNKEIILIGGDYWGKGEDTHTNEILIHNAKKIPWESKKKIKP